MGRGGRREREIERERIMRSGEIDREIVQLRKRQLDI